METPGTEEYVPIFEEDEEPSKAMPEGRDLMDKSETARAEPQMISADDLHFREKALEQAVLFATGTGATQVVADAEVFRKFLTGQ